MTKRVVVCAVFVSLAVAGCGGRDALYVPYGDPVDASNIPITAGTQAQTTEAPDAEADGGPDMASAGPLDAGAIAIAPTLDAQVIKVDGAQDASPIGPPGRSTVDAIAIETKLPDALQDRTADALRDDRSDDPGPLLDLPAVSAPDRPGTDAGGPAESPGHTELDSAHTLEDAQGADVADAAQIDASAACDGVAAPDTPIEQPSQPPVFIASGGGRGPLSTTITTDKTSVDVVPTLKNQTVRVMLRTTAAGSQVQIKLTNRYSTDPLPIGAAHVAIRGSGGSIVQDSDRILLFDGAGAATLAAGTDLWSDPVDLAVARGDTLAISTYVDATLTPTTESGRANLPWMIHYVSQPGDHTAATTMPAATSGPSTTHTILFVSEVRVLPAGPAATLVTLGDSITECATSTSENGDWPDLLSDRLPALSDGTVVSVFNAGIGSGRFASGDGAGLRGLLRLDELLLLPNVRWVTILMGVNDISYEDATADELIDAYTTAIDKAHAAGVQIIGIPILPFKGSKKDVGANWETAEAVNRWIRGENRFDHIIDFQPVLEDPDRPGYLEESLTSDKVHPNQAGYTAMANAVDLSIFR